VLRSDVLIAIQRIKHGSIIILTDAHFILYIERSLIITGIRIIVGDLIFPLDRLDFNIYIALEKLNLLPAYIYCCSNSVLRYISTLYVYSAERINFRRKH
jgi:hypothetical protein